MTIADVTPTAATPLVALDVIEAADRRIRPHLVATPLVGLGYGGLAVKPEYLQPGGAFKIRGALNAMLQLTDPAEGAGRRCLIDRQSCTGGWLGRADARHPGHHRHVARGA